MPIVCTERPRQSIESHYLRPGMTREYVISGTRETLSAQLALINGSEAIVTGIDIEGSEIVLFRDSFTLKEAGQGVWEGTVKYESSADVTDLQWTFGATSTKIFEALEEIVQFDLENGGTDTGLVPEFGKTIGVNGDEVEGVDVEVSTLDIVVTKKYRRASMPVTYFELLIELMDIRTPVNNAEYTIFWKGLGITFAKGTLRLRGTPIKWTSNDEIEISYNFQYQRGQLEADGFRLRNSDVLTREGHDYGWASYRLTVANGETTRTPESYNVVRVYPQRDFSVLLL